MRILTLTNLYPPHYIGGYELACSEIMSRLSARGHDVLVLTSDYRRPESVAEEPNGRTRIERVFPWRRSAWSSGALRSEFESQRFLKRACREWKPDLISVWNFGGISLGLLSTAISRGVPVVPSISDYWLPEALEGDSWLQRWRQTPPSRWRRLAKRFVRPLATRLVETSLDARRLMFGHFFSRFLKGRYEAQGLAPANSTIIHHGVDLETFRFREDVPTEPTKLLFVGRLDPLKGVHVAIEALGILVNRLGRSALTLDLVGPIDSPEYLARLERIIGAHGLQSKVRFVGSKRREELPEVYRSYDLLLFPSIWDEPFSIALLEAMASGIPSVATASGGSAEILRDGVNALVAETGDPESMALQVERLLGDRSLREGVRTAARSDVASACEIGRTVTCLEAFFTSVAS